MSKRKTHPVVPPKSTVAWLYQWWSARAERGPKPSEVINLDAGPGNYMLGGHVPWPRLGPHHSPRDPALPYRYEPTVRDPAPEQLEDEFRRAAIRGALRVYLDEQRVALAARQEG